MRLIVLGDIHANLPALEAALAAAAGIACDRILHAGDLVGYGAHPNETIDRILDAGIDGARGHFDESAAWGGDHTPCGRGDPGALRLADLVGEWTRRALSFDSREFLKDLPFSLELESGGRRIMLVHGSPTDLLEPLDAATGEARLREVIDDMPREIYISAHTHIPSERDVEGRRFINVGSVGFPGDGDPRGCLALIDLGREVRVEFVRFSYDVEAAARGMAARGLPRAAIDLLRSPARQLLT